MTKNLDKEAPKIGLHINLDKAKILRRVPPSDLFTSVPTTIRTNNFITYYNAKSRDEMLQLVLQKDVEITPTFPENFTLLDCPFPKNVPVDYYRRKTAFFADSDVLRACEAGQFGNEFVVFDLVKRRFFKNIFCAISYRGDCHPLRCGPGKEFLDGKCTARVEEIKGLSYRLCLWLQPIPSERQKLYSLVLTDLYARKTFYSLFNKIKEMVEEFTTNYRLDVGGLVDTNSIPFLKFPAIFWMECLLFARQNIIQNDFDIQILNQFMYGNISVQNFENAKLIVKPFQMLPRFVVANSVAQNLINQSQTVYLDAEYKSESFITGLKVDYISVNHVLMCRFVRFEPEQYQADVRDDVIPPDLTLTIDLNGTKILITDNADLNMVDIGQDGELNVCEDLLNSKLKIFRDDVLEGTNRELAGTSLAEYIVSIACSSASILCLVLTLMTYVLFSELRTEAGLNNMFLSSSLLLAQVCLMITSLLFTEHNVYSSWCGDSLHVAVDVLLEFPLQLPHVSSFYFQYQKTLVTAGKPTSHHTNPHHLTTHHLISPQITSPNITKHHPTSPHLPSHQPTSPHQASTHITSPNITKHHLTKHHQTSPHITLPNITPHNITSDHLIKHHHTSPHITSPNITPHHLTKHHPTSPHRTSPHITSPNITPHITSPNITSSSHLF
uniref:Uncharacterized protein n=1 Tax=Biomphalaria glabrata TaxID=6526 RepID=A0A2C9LS57_BIOGL